MFVYIHTYVMIIKKKVSNLKIGKLEGFEWVSGRSWKEEKENGK